MDAEIVKRRAAPTGIYRWSEAESISPLNGPTVHSSVDAGIVHILRYADIYCMHDIRS